MASRNIDIDQVVKDALSLIAEKYPDDYRKLSPSQANGVASAARETVSHLVSFLSREGEKSIDDFPNVGGDKMMRNYTFEMAIKTSEGHRVAEFDRGGRESRPTIDLSSQPGIEQSGNLQMASILIESVIFILQLIGIDIPDDEEEVDTVIVIAIEALKHDNKLVIDIDAIVKAYNDGSMSGVAEKMVILVIDVFEEGILWQITKALLSDLTQYQWLLTSVKIAAFIVAMVATGGIAEIAKLVSTLADAAFFIMKLANHATLKSMQAN